MSNEAAAIIAHYLRQLAARNGFRWTAENDRDMNRLAAALGQDAPADTIPPYQSDERATVVLERDPAASDTNYQEWRRRQYADDADTAAVRRMTRR
jgi:hypothetical protein